MELCQKNNKDLWEKKTLNVVRYKNIHIKMPFWHLLERIQFSLHNRITHNNTNTQQELVETFI